jgi:hypothetical protein
VHTKIQNETKTKTISKTKPKQKIKTNVKTDKNDKPKTINKNGWLFRLNDRIGLIPVFGSLQFILKAAGDRNQVKYLI